MAASPSTSTELTVLRDAIRRGETLRDRLDAAADGTNTLVADGQSWIVPRPQELRRAVAGWTAVIFGTCYVALPFGAEVFGLYPGLLRNLGSSALSLAVMALLTVGVLRVVRPEVRIPRDLANAPRDPVIAATAGGFGTWLVLHNLIPGLMHFDMMSSTMVMTFAAFNLLEGALWGMMLASFVRSRTGAFVLGAAFQLVLMLIWCGIVIF
ncbi:MAG: hypothetical protein H6739_07475 [Alphaproteobacteria bacterium]|nr:hypothetical protein [Alphaproteobacteria bacterium]